MYVCKSHAGAGRSDGGQPQAHCAMSEERLHAAHSDSNLLSLQVYKRHNDDALARMRLWHGCTLSGWLRLAYTVRVHVSCQCGQRLLFACHWRTVNALLPPRSVQRSGSVTASDSSISFRMHDRALCCLHRFRALVVRVRATVAALTSLSQGHMFECKHITVSV